jgi:hypothetical protein
MKFVQHTVVNAPVEQVDLEDWLFTLSDTDYQAAAKGHRAAGTFITDGVRGMVNVEVMGGGLIIQHYREVHAERTRVEMLSERSRMLSETMRSKLVVGVDGSVASDAAVRWAGREALMRGLPITVVNVVAPTLISSTMAPNDNHHPGTRRPGTGDPGSGATN